MSESTVIAIVLNALIWAFSAGVVWAKLGSIERALSRNERTNEAIENKLQSHADRLFRIETRCRIAHPTLDNEQ